MIPTQLQQLDFRFVKVYPGTKKPIGLQWGQKAQPYDYATIQNHIKNGGNLGFLCGSGNTIVIDFDDEEFQKKILPLLPKTFSIKSGGKGLLHLYYKTDHPETMRINGDDKRLCDVLGSSNGTSFQALIPPSIHPISKKVYTIHDDLPIAFLPMRTIKEIFSPYIETEKTRPIKEKKNTPSQDDTVHQIKTQLNVSDLSGLEPGTHLCPFHSEKNPSFEIRHDGEAWVCYAGCGKGDVFNFYAMQKFGNTDTHNADKFKEIIQDLAKKAGIEVKPAQEKNNVVKITEAEIFLQEQWIKKLYIGDPNDKPADKAKVRKTIIEEIAKHFITTHTIITLEEDDEIYYHTKGVYKKLGEAFIKKETDRILGSSNTNLDKEIINTVKRKSYLSQERKKPAINLVCLRNGTLNTQTQQIQPHDPKNYFFNQLPVSYTPDAKCEKWETFIKEVVTSEDALTLQEFAGYCLLRDHRFHNLLLLIGETRNGKSTFLNILNSLLGEENTTSASLQQLTMDKFMLAELHQKIANIYPDLSSTGLKDTGVLKALTGEDKIGTQHKYGKPFNFRNSAKLLFSCNTMPPIEDGGKAIFNRFLIVEFPNSFKGKENLNLRIELESELSGILNWSILGLKRLLEQGRFTESKRSAENREYYMRNSDSALAFVTERCSFDRFVQTEKGKVWDAYRLFCALTGIIEQHHHWFWKRFYEHTSGKARLVPAGDKDFVLGVSVKGCDTLLVEEEKVV